MRALSNRGLLSFVFAVVPAFVVACSDDDAAMDGEHAAGMAGQGADGGDDSRAGTGGSKPVAGNGGTPSEGGKQPVAGKSGSEAGGVGNPEAGAGGGGGESAAGDAYVLTSANRLLFVNRASAEVVSAVELTGLAVDDEELLGMDLRPSDGELYAVASSGAVYTLDRETGAATLKTTLDADPADASEPFAELTGDSFGVDFNPVANRLRVVSRSGQNLRINVDAAADNTTTDGALNPGTPSVTAAAYTNSFGAACRTRLYVIDSVSSKLLLQDPPNDGKLSEVGALGVNADALGAFEIVTDGAGANAALIIVDDQLYDVDLATGAAAKPRRLGLKSGETVLGLGVPAPSPAPAQAVGELLGITESNKLISFNRGAPGKLCSSVAVTGLADAESLLGLDVRPSDGLLYAPGDSGKLYTLNIATGAATAAATLAADATDTTEAFSELMGDSFGVGFNPVPDRLRVVSDSQQNLRINVASATGVITDAALNPTAPDITAVAYTNSFAGARGTTLFGLDTTADSLVRIGSDPSVAIAPAPTPVCPTDVGNPNCGVVTEIGPLGIGDVSAINGFDIDGRTGATGSALAALSVGAATTSSLYSIDLNTGAASNPPGVANPTIGGGERLRGLTFVADASPIVVALTSAARVIRFAPATPNTLLTDVAVTGLQASESLLGLDLRPSDGKLYAVGSSGRLYALDATTGAVVQVAQLAAASGDDNPFAALTPGVAHGLDFNPVPDLLRVVSTAEDNLRIVPTARTLSTVAQTAGATFTDAALTPDTADVVAAAYTNSFNGAALTTLFVLDSTADALLRQGGPDGTPSPNAGALTTIGALGVAAEGNIGFDIAGGRNGLALAAIRPSDSAVSSKLYSINLASGAAALYPSSSGTPTIGTEGTTPQITNLAIELK
jgi:hypothetical protein